MELAAGYLEYGSAAATKAHIPLIGGFHKTKARRILPEVVECLCLLPSRANGVTR